MALNNENIRNSEGYTSEDRQDLKDDLLQRSTAQPDTDAAALTGAGYDTGEEGDEDYDDEEEDTEDVSLDADETEDLEDADLDEEDLDEADLDDLDADDDEDDDTDRTL